MKRIATLTTFVAAALTASSVRAGDPSLLAFTVEIDSNGNVPTFTVTNNSPVAQFNQFRITIGNTSRNFDGDAFTPTVVGPSAGGATVDAPSGSDVN